MVESIHDPATVVSQYIAATTDTADSASRTEFSTILSTLLESKELSLLQFIQVLGPYLTSDSDSIRPKSIQCISDTLAELAGKNSKILTRQDLTVLLDFLLTKLDDNSSIQFIFQCLSSLCRFDKFNFDPLLEKLLTTIVSSYNPKTFLAKVRYESFVLVETVISRFHTNINGTSTSDGGPPSPLFNPFVKAYIHIATGEKDPRNLLVSFNTNTLISQKLTFDAVRDEEFLIDLFDVVFCYFPISFTPPANDPYKITSDDLKLRLRSAIAAQPLYAKDSIPSLIEKLTSTNPVVRNDVLKTLRDVVSTYDAPVVEEYWLTVWNALKYEVIHNDVSIFKPFEDLIVRPDYDSVVDDNDEFKPLIITLDIVQLLGQKLDSDNNSSIELVVDTVTKELEKNLSTVTDKVFKQSVLLVGMLAGSGERAFNKVIDFLFSYDVWGKYLGNQQDQSVASKAPTEAQSFEVEITNDDITLTVAKQRDLIDNFGFILNSYNALTLQILGSGSTADFEAFTASNHLINYKDSLLIFLGQLLQTSSNLEKTLKSKTIQQLKKLIQLNGFLTLQECSLIFGYFNDILVDTMETEPKNWERDTVVQEVKSALSAIMDDSSSANKSGKVELVIETILPNLLSKLPDSEEDGVSVDRVLSLIGDLCVNYKFLEILSIRLLNKLSYYSQSKSANYYISTVKLLIDSIVKTESSHQFLMNSWYKNFVPRFTKSIVVIVDAVSRDPESGSSGVLEELVEVSGDLLALIIRYIDKAQHETILNDFTQFFVNEDASSAFQPKKGEVAIVSLIKKQSIYINIFNKVLASVNKSKSESFGTVKAIDFIEQDIKFSKEDADANLVSVSYIYVRLGYLKNLALLLNKFYNSTPDFLKEYLDRVESAASSAEPLTESFLQDFEVFVWSVKGLIMKTDATGISYLIKLISFLSCENEELRKLISKSLSIIMIDLSLFTNPYASATTAASPTGSSTKLISGVQSYNVRLLYKQRIFESILPTLIEGFQNSASSTSASSAKSSYLVALSNILKNITTKILRPHLSTITPLILTSLSIKNTDILKSSLETCEIIIRETPDIIIPHLQSLVPKLVELAVTRNAVSTEEIRLLALKCLISVFTKLELKQVLKYQKSSIQKLAKGLDDKKRNVRKKCADLRQILYELGR